jgi:lysophospholipase L1-like esterase
MNFKTILFAGLILTLGVKARAQTKLDTTTAPVKKFGGYPNEEEQRIHTDWPNLNRFKKNNAKLEDTVNSGDRVVFMGNSIFELWLAVEPSFFNTHTNYINRGISGQTTPQMLLRFRQDVIDLKPKVVVFLGGTNDIAGNTGPETIDQIYGNIKSMCELAKENHIKVILISVLPVYDYPWKPGMEPALKIIALNKKLKTYADLNKVLYVDLHTKMADNRNGLPLNLSKDGVHPTKEGYLMMEPQTIDAINKALK